MDQKEQRKRLALLASRLYTCSTPVGELFKFVSASQEAFGLDSKGLAALLDEIIDELHCEAGNGKET